MKPFATYNKNNFMQKVITEKEQTQSNKINRYAYTLFLVLVVYLIIVKDYEMAVTNMGIALVFDPFDATVKWQDRPSYQRVWLITHVAIAFIGLGCLLFL